VVGHRTAGYASGHRISAGPCGVGLRRSPHHAYLFANRLANRMKVLVHDGIGVWLAARRLNSGKFVWPRDAASTAALTRAQLDALVLGLPWQRLADGGVITVV